MCSVPVEGFEEEMTGVPFDNQRLANGMVSARSPRCR
jgi:hypothetical protein